MGEFVLRSAVSLSLILSPILAAQGRRLRRTASRLPEAGGPCTGVCPGAPPPLRLLLAGESTAAGVGASEHSQALAGQLALAIAAATGRSVAWQVVGRSGATARSARTMVLQADLEFPPEVVVLALGVNDVFRMRGPGAWRADLRELVTAVRARCGPAAVVFAAIPPVGRLPALPQPLRSVLGMRAKLLDRAAHRLAREMEGVRHTGSPGVLSDAEAELFFCPDGIHPSPAGYALWARQLAAAVVAACGAPAE